jgi:hypothetical protein
VEAGVTGGESAVYLYGLVKSRRPPALGGAPAGLPGTGRPRVLPAGASLWLVVADAPLARYGAEVIDRKLRDLDWLSRCALAHEAVVEHAGRAGTVVPTKLFTLFTSEARALAHVRRAGARLARVLDRLAGRQEWGVRLTVDAARAAAAPRAAGRPRAAREGAGTRFLLAKRAEQGAARRLAAHARVEAGRVFRDLGRHADAARRRAPIAADGPARLVLDAAFLVSRGRGRRFRAAVGATARRLAGQGFRVTLTGPWPAYNFVGPRG